MWTLLQACQCHQKGFLSTVSEYQSDPYQKPKNYFVPKLGIAKESSRADWVQSVSSTPSGILIPVLQFVYEKIGREGNEKYQISEFKVLVPSTNGKTGFAVEWVEKESSLTEFTPSIPSILRNVYINNVVSSHSSTFSTLSILPAQVRMLVLSHLLL